MTQDTQIPDPAAIREKLLDTFTPETLHRFCQDRPPLHPILPYFGLKYNLHDMIDEVITYCDTRDFWTEFLTELEGYDPSQYAPAVPIIPTPFNLPADLPDFTGRHSEIDQVREALSREGAVAISGIHGMGGIGKTALALHIAHQLAATENKRVLDDSHLKRVILDLEGQVG
jgi:hypothetical protein